jgi:hypothetical protein
VQGMLQLDVQGRIVEIRADWEPRQG